MSETAFWQALYTAGHDAALLEPAGPGWRLSGTAVFLHDGVPASLTYTLDLDAGWATRSGSVDGVLGTRRIARRIERAGDHWTLDGIHQPQVEGLLDLDFGFTPATNCPQLRRMALGIGQSAEIAVAWLDVESEVLEPLPQFYRRLDECSYDYNSPQGPYRATLRLAESGFVADYPELWRIVPAG